MGLGDSSDGGHRYALVAGAPSTIFEDESLGKLAIQLGLGAAAGVGGRPPEFLGEFRYQLVGDALGERSQDEDRTEFGVLESLDALVGSLR